MSAERLVQRMRAREQARYMPDTAAVQRSTQTPDGMGGTTDAWATIATVACRVDPAGASAEERVIADQVQGETTATIVVPHGTDVTAADRIVTGGSTFEVIGVIVGSWEPNLRAVCRRIT